MRLRPDDDIYRARLLFLGPKGFNAVRPQDHALLQPMFRVELVKGSNGKLQPKVLGTASSYATAPPLVAMKG